MNCPVCNNSSNKVKYRINNYSILACLRCSHHFTLLKANCELTEKIYSDNYFFGGNEGYPNYTLEKDLLTARGEKYAAITARYMEPGSMVDIGAAAGFIMKGFQNCGWKVTGIEPNNTMANYGKKILGLDIRQGTLENYAMGLSADLVCLIQVIAHLYDLELSMVSIREIINKNGCILIETWDKDSIMARLFGENWHEYSPPATLNYFSKKTLDLFMTNHGYYRIAGGRPGKMIHSKHARSLLKYKLNGSRSFQWLSGIEKLIPKNTFLPYPAEDLFWALYRRTENPKHVKTQDNISHVGKPA